MMMNTNKNQVLITGIGVMTSIGHNVTDFTLALKEGKCGITELSCCRESGISVKIGAEIRNFTITDALAQHVSDVDFLTTIKKFINRSPFYIQATIPAICEAWKKAGLYNNKIDPHRIGIIVAGSNLGSHVQYMSYEKCKTTPEYLSAGYIINYLDTNLIGIAGELFKVKGESFTIGGASASGNAGIIKAAQLIQMDVLDLCIVVGPVTELSPVELQGFYNLGAMGGKLFEKDPDKACRPFDTEHEGFIYGQGAGCLILESTESIQKRNVPVLGELIGWGYVMDANRLTNPDEGGEALSMMQALEKGGISAHDIEYINCHGTSSPLGDEIELKAIKKVFKESISKIWINSTKSLTGHCLFSAGIIEAIAVLVQMNNGFLHPNRNLIHPIDEEFRFVGEKAVPYQVRYALNNSFGFSGFNTCIMLKK